MDTIWLGREPTKNRLMIAFQRLIRYRGEGQVIPLGLSWQIFRGLTLHWRQSAWKVRFGWLNGEGFFWWPTRLTSNG